MDRWISSNFSYFSLIAKQVLLKMWALEHIVVFALLPFSTCNFLTSKELQDLAGKVYASSNNPNGLDTYSNEEFKKLPVLRQRVAKSLTHSYMFENAFLVRYLKQGRNDIDISEKLLLKHIEWKKSQDIDEFVKKDLTNWFRRAPHYFNVDHDGRGGIVLPIASWDIRRFVLNGEINEFIKYLASVSDHLCQVLPDIINGTGREIYSGNILYNAAGFGARTHMCLACMPFWLELINFPQTHYVYFYKRIIYINVPRIAERLVAYLKPFMTPHLTEILHLYGVDKNEWEEIFKIYPKDQLQVEFGGTVSRPIGTNYWLNAGTSNYSRELQEKITPFYLL